MKALYHISTGFPVILTFTKEEDHNMEYLNEHWNDYIFIKSSTQSQIIGIKSPGIFSEEKGPLTRTRITNYFLCEFDEVEK